MLIFRVFEDGQPAQAWPLRNAYLIGSDGNPIRADVATEPGLIVCDKRDPGSGALCLLFPAGELGELCLQTTLLPERDEPYVLTVELLRHRLMLVYSKLEEWGLLQLDTDSPAGKRVLRARQKFIDALCVQDVDPAGADVLAREGLAIAVDGSEELALTASQAAIDVRKNSGALASNAVGCGIALNHTKDKVRQALASQVDFVQLPTPWRAITPKEDDYKWNVLDGWADWCKQTKTPVLAGPLISLQKGQLPDWIYAWQNDYETLRDIVYAHIEKVLTQYGGTFQVWNIVSGLHVNEHFQLSFDQLMDLTRLATMLFKKIVPEGKTLIEVQQPWGEYYAHHQRSIPPQTYIDLIEQASLSFDAYGVRLPLGQARPGQFARDLMQVSALLDEFAGVGKPLYVTFAVPSEPVTSVMIEAPGEADALVPADDVSGTWRRPWSPEVQAHWLEACFQIAMGKPYVEAVAWQELIDHDNIELPLSGLVREDYSAKPALRRFSSFRRSLKKKPEMYVID